MVLTDADTSGAPGKAMAGFDVVGVASLTSCPGVRIVQAVDFVPDDPPAPAP